MNNKKRRYAPAYIMIAFIPIIFLSNCSEDRKDTDTTTIDVTPFYGIAIDVEGGPAIPVNEPGRVKVTLTIGDPIANSIARLSLTDCGSGLSFWTSSTGGTQISLPYEYAAAAAPIKDVFIDVDNVCTSDDPRITFEYLETATSNVSLKAIEDLQLISFSSPIADGPYSAGITTVTYASSGLQYISRYQNPTAQYEVAKRIDISDFQNSISTTWGFDATNIPINGRLVIPPGTGPFPLALFVHGNHNAFDFSDEGYLYLCNLLASYGIIAATIDENFLNGLTGEVDARAIVMLEHLVQFRTWNTTSGHPLYGKIDLSNVMVVGHSRGGEGVAHLSHFNNLDVIIPDVGATPVLVDGTAGLGPYHFGISAVVSIAPTENWYYPVDPSNPSQTLPTAVNGNYFLIHGSRDGDVFTFEGAIIYDRSNGFNPANQGTSVAGTKSLLWVHGANHGYFNESWNNESRGTPTLTRTEQENIAKAFINSVAQVYLLNNHEYIKILANFQIAKKWLASTEYVSQIHPRERMYINHFEEEDNESTLSPPFTGSNSFPDLASYDDILFNLGPYSRLYQETDGLVAEWNNYNGGFITQITGGIPNPNTYKYLSMRIGQSDEASNTAGTIQNASIRISDSDGNSADYFISSLARLPYPDDHSTTSGQERKTVMQSINIPSSKLIADGLDMSKLNEIALLFDVHEHGKVYIDDIQLTNY